jgi:3-oxoacyl-[acyl-carrier protein] reductase
MDTGLSDKVVLVTGASGGIGRELARAFLAERARLALVGHARSAELAALARAEGWPEVQILSADVSDPAQVDRAFEQALARFGRIDVCVANAGLWPPEDRPVHELDPERVRLTVGANLLGSLWTARAFLAALARTGPRGDGHGAALVFTGSTAGRFGERGHADYAMAKAGLRGLVLTLKNEITRLDPYGRVNLVEPGWTATEMARPALEDPAALARAASTMAVRQLGRAKDVARAIVFLSSPLLARHVSGETLCVAGGMEGRLLWERGEIDPARMRARLQEP